MQETTHSSKILRKKNLNWLLIIYIYAELFHKGHIWLKCNVTTHNFFVFPPYVSNYWKNKLIIDSIHKDIKSDYPVRWLDFEPTKKHNNVFFYLISTKYQLVSYIYISLSFQKVDIAIQLFATLSFEALYAYRVESLKYLAPNVIFYSFFCFFFFFFFFFFL